MSSPCHPLSPQAELRDKEIMAALEEDFGQDADALQTIQGWLIDIQRGRKDLHDIHRSGRL
jgi:hypothetical protein